MRIVAALAALWAAAVTWLALDHPYGMRFAMGIWPVPPGTPWTYQLESGFVPALTVLTLLSAIGSLYHLHNCHQDGCWRFGKHRVNGTPYCRRHEHLVRPAVSTEELLAGMLGELRAVRKLLEAPAEESR